MYRTVLWTQWERERVGRFGKKKKKKNPHITSKLMERDDKVIENNPRRRKEANK